MLVDLLPGVGADFALRHLQDSVAETANIGSRLHHRTGLHELYLRWAQEQATKLRHIVSGADLERLVLTRRYWSLQSQPLSTDGYFAQIIDDELTERLGDFKLAVGELAAESERWKLRPGHLVLADTNVYLHHGSHFDEIPWWRFAESRAKPVTLLIPLLVVDELDAAKSSGKSDVRSRARTTLKRLDGYFQSPDSGAILEASDFPAHGEVRASVIMDRPSHIRLSDADYELIDRALDAESLSGRAVRLVTYDTGMALRARNAGLHVAKLDHM